MVRFITATAPLPVSIFCISYFYHSCERRDIWQNLNEKMDLCTLQFNGYCLSRQGRAAKARDSDQCKIETQKYKHQTLQLHGENLGITTPPPGLPQAFSFLCSLSHFSGSRSRELRSDVELDYHNCWYPESYPSHPVSLALSSVIIQELCSNTWIRERF